MPSRSDFPGLQRSQRKDGSVALHWVAPRVAVAAGYPVRTVRLHYEEGSAHLAERCQDLHAQALAWLWEEGKAGHRTVFDGTLGSLIRLYETLPESPFNNDKAESTRRGYIDDMRLLERVVGARRLDRLNGIDFRRWYRDFRKPREPGGPERIRRAHGIMTMLRILLSFGVELGLPHAERLRNVLSNINFPKPPPRTQQITFQQATAFIAKAHEFGFPEMALAQALQFEATLRQWSVIGEWAQEGEPPYALRWQNGLLWNEISADRILTHKTTKTGQTIVIDLNDYPLIVAELDRLPAIPRIGPVIIDGKTGEPFKHRAYSGRWREIARAAGIPDDVWNRDSRAGGVTEGGDAGADIEDLRHHAGHSDTRTTQIYNRRTLEKTKRVARLRVEHRNKP
jgi:integrase